MKIKSLTSKPLPMLLGTVFLSSILLVSGCSNNDKDTTDISADGDNTAVSAETGDAEMTSDANDPTESLAVDGNEDDSTKDEIAITNDDINPVTSDEQPSLVTNPMNQEGSPEAAVEQALNTLYYGDVKEAASYYKVDIANFEEELANTQSAFQKTVDSVTLIDTKYNDDKTRATINGELMLKGQSDPAPLTYELQKIEGAWKILG